MLRNFIQFTITLDFQAVAFLVSEAMLSGNCLQLTLLVSCLHIVLTHYITPVFQQGSAAQSGPEIIPNPRAPVLRLGRARLFRLRQNRICAFWDTCRARPTQPG